MAFLNASKTEREAAKNAAALLEEKGFVPFTPDMKLQAGDKIYVNNRGKAIIAAVIGTAPITEGVRLCAAHIDSPRLDMKQNPLYEDHELAMFKTHYYDNIPQGTLKFLGAFGRRFLKISTSTCASMYEIIQNTEPARIRKEIISAELSLKYPKIRIAALTNI